jgi:hypothetical protein
MQKKTAGFRTKMIGVTSIPYLLVGDTISRQQQPAVTFRFPTICIIEQIDLEGREYTFDNDQLRNQ